MIQYKKRRKKRNILTQCTTFTCMSVIYNHYQRINLRKVNYYMNMYNETCIKPITDFNVNTIDAVHVYVYYNVKYYMYCISLTVISRARNTM